MPPTESPKKNFILSYGLDKPPVEILAAAKKAGLTISRAYIDILRKGGAKKSSKPAGVAKRKPGRPKKSAAKSAAPAAAAPAARRPGRPRKSASAPATKSVASAAPARGGDSAFRNAAAHLVIESGAARAREVLEDVVAKIRGAVR